MSVRSDRSMAKRDMAKIVVFLRRLYANDGFQFGLLIFDVLTVLSFLVLTFTPHTLWVDIFDAVLGALLLAEVMMRGLVSYNRPKFWRQPSTILDLVIVCSLLWPGFTGSFAFLRVLRVVRLVRAVPFLRDLPKRHLWLIEKGELLRSAVNLLIFVFVASALVYEAQADQNPAINTFSDALYFTVTTLTTTGFGDVTLVGESGRLISVVIMIVGISLFVKLAQSIVRPSKVYYPCDQCGLSHHDPDAVHCKHCGNQLAIPTEGL
ncbi:potassium channel family protein [Pedomonas mirosovicensis]|uniref:potassium channel family protein n=1 Tax=Pedomonas mirosovicensis TaxID=2908641 RepID=UPI002168DBD6|nr:potassium channel family protein [Pedomonas mirosovicensis]MCH8683865.1 potassium channel family protein [Pedomonas mirosovicensis]